MLCLTASDHTDIWQFANKT